MSYRQLFRSQTPMFLPLGFLARLPYAALPLATLIFLQDATGSYAFAGIACGAQSIAIGVGGLAVGALATRVEPRRIGTAAAVANAVAVLALVASSRAGAVAMLAAAVVAGLTQPQVGPLVRVHWARRIRGRDDRLLSTAHSYEGAADEVGFVVGPIVVGALAAAPTPFGAAAPLLGAAALLMCAALPFASMYATAPQRAEPGTQASSDRLPRADLALLVLAMAAVGVIFGAVQTGLTALAREEASIADSGLLYAVLGIGSAAAGAGCAWLPARFPIAARYVLVAVGLLAGSVVLLGGHLLHAVPVAVFVCGLAIGPYMVTLYTLVSVVSPLHRVAFAIAVLCAGGPVGTALGQAVAGWLVETVGVAAAFAVPPVAGLVGVVVALTFVRTSPRLTAVTPAPPGC